MAALGTFTLLAAFVTCSYAIAASVAGARRGSRRLVESGVGALYLVAGLLTAASAVILHAFVSSDYSIKYVQRYSDAALPLFYKLTSYWGGLDGSLLFWAFLLSVFGSFAVLFNRERQRDLIPYVVATIAAVEMFFLFLMIIHNDPFQTFLVERPADGRGLNPLLQNFYMAIHPPALYIGFVGMTIPFAFGLAALMTGRLDDSWLRAVRRWTMVSWFFLSFGLVLGMLWAYEELGWGGYWGWDPVENAGLLPWFTATAFLHSVIVQERRAMLRVWNVTLVIVTFFLTIFGTFMTRSGVVQSVHAFGEDRALAWMFTVFMVVILVVSFGLVIHRLPLLRSRNELDSLVSREAAFLANNWILLFAAFLVLFATMFPTLSEAVTGDRLTVGPPFFNKWMAPIGLALLFLTGAGPLLAWRKSTPANLRQQFLWPLTFALAVSVAVVALGVRVWSSGLCFALSAFVAGTLWQEFWRGAHVRRATTKTDLLTALVGLVARSPRRYGGYLVHLGIVLMFLGFAGEAFKLSEQVLLKPGQRVSVGRYMVRHDAVRIDQDGQKQIVAGRVTVERDGRNIGEMRPARWFYKGREEEPTTEVAIRRGFAEDLYIVLAGYDAQPQSATYEITVNPLVNWIWAGFGILAIGTAIALMPESAFAFAVVRAPAHAAAATMILLLLLPAAVRAQHEEGPSFAAVTPRTELEKELYREIVCLCGTCGKKLIGECQCGYAAKMRDQVSRLVAEGRTREEIYRYFVVEYGSEEPLAAPLDRGFNRLAWSVPYLGGAGGLVLMIGVARRWSRRSANAAPESTSSTEADVRNGDAALEPTLEARVDDALRDID
jgi:cytochrome c-type biogenesis protein CcmF